MDKESEPDVGGELFSKQPSKELDLLVIVEDVHEFILKGVGRDEGW